MVALLPLDKVYSKPISQDKIENANTISKRGAVLALDLTEYEEELEPAMKFVFGNILFVIHLKLQKKFSNQLYFFPHNSLNKKYFKKIFFSLVIFSVNLLSLSFKLLVIFKWSLFSFPLIRDFMLWFNSSELLMKLLLLFEILLFSNLNFSFFFLC